ncbi:hypothetical protein NC652_036691 [Populus alba x Populus x berolinensis]|nr:hypothetical protein NC652_036691 [Populus alba x Populus x berolinensis]
MVTGGGHLEDGDRHPSSAATRGGGGGGGATTGSWVSGQSVSTSGSVGSPSSRSEHAMATPASDTTFLRLNHLDIHADDAATQDAAASVFFFFFFFFSLSLVDSLEIVNFDLIVQKGIRLRGLKLFLSMISNKKKKRGQRAAGGADKSGRGLRQFSMKVCEKVESKGTTTYNEVRHLFSRKCLFLCIDDLLAALYSGASMHPFMVISQEQLYLVNILLDLYAIVECFLGDLSRVADELVAEFADPSNSVSTPDQQQYDEKNIRRRVYDALNVLMALDIISKDKKEIQWKGLPRTSLSDIEELKAERLGLRNRIEKKAAYLQELEEQVRIATLAFSSLLHSLVFLTDLSCPIKFMGLQNLIQRNEQLYSSGNAPSGGVSLPFILVQVSIGMNPNIPLILPGEQKYTSLTDTFHFSSMQMVLWTLIKQVFNILILGVKWMALLNSQDIRDSTSQVVANRSDKA